MAWSEVQNAVEDAVLYGLVQGMEWDFFNVLGQKHGLFAVRIMGWYRKEVTKNKVNNNKNYNKRNNYMNYSIGTFSGGTCLVSCSFYTRRYLSAEESSSNIAICQNCCEKFQWP